MRRTQLASQVSFDSPPTHAVAVDGRQARHPPHRGVCHIPHGVGRMSHVDTTLSQCWTMPLDLPRLLTSLDCSMANVRLIAREGLPPNYTSLLFHPASAAHIRYREPEGEGSVRLHLEQIPRHRPRIRCHCCRRWRSWSPRGIRSR